MKQKFANKTDGSLLGQAIQRVRKQKGLTQEQLGKRVGLPKSSICKIETGATHISFEDASLLFDAMGENIGTQVFGMSESIETKVARSRFVTICIAWYANHRQISFSSAYRQLLIYKGINFLEKTFEYEQTQPRETIMNDLNTIVANNGGNYVKRHETVAQKQPFKNY